MSENCFLPFAVSQQLDTMTSQMRTLSAQQLDLQEHILRLMPLVDLLTPSTLDALEDPGKALREALEALASSVTDLSRRLEPVLSGVARETLVQSAVTKELASMKNMLATISRQCQSLFEDVTPSQIA